MSLSVVVSPVTVVRMEAATSDGALPPRNPDPSPRLSFSKPSWVVRTESNVHREVRKTPDPPCEICTGSGRIHCHFCQGKGRTNSVDMQMLPKGKWPRWCKTCGGSGLSYCSRCLGTGEYRYIMGFHFMKMDSAHTGDNANAVQSNQKRRTAEDLYE
ncbi:PREDICTED: uncharacterized protein LOC101313643 [Fragaria vesca subsp. vesca]|uniref:uncharacterized protein LOC101313643 n=1 Tax=Fragaria vesca subsp. vesca TaxID=101020 RepID=UPI0002C2E6F2|nr:PREDICTED: uncharacterized protein LOC101313643 [Fragaria vesca subsp. vesca]